ncbi:MAG: hypothetical protein PHU71_00240 [Candidatus Gracilibacteria bacterium]|nr:hypothetical protein [Candidatus Gracilibacteria bacterium]
MSDENEVKPGEEKKVPLEKQSDTSKDKKVKNGESIDIEDGGTVEFVFESKQKVPASKIVDQAEQSSSDTVENQTESQESSNNAKQEKPKKKDGEGSDNQQELKDHPEKAAPKTNPEREDKSDDRRKGSKAERPAAPEESPKEPEASTPQQETSSPTSSAPNNGSDPRTGLPQEQAAEEPGKGTDNAQQIRPLGASPARGEASSKEEAPSSKAEESGPAGQQEPTDKEAMEGPEEAESEPTNSEETGSTQEAPSEEQEKKGTDNAQQIKEAGNIPGQGAQQEADRKKEREENDKDLENGEEGENTEGKKKKVADKVRQKGEELKKHIDGAAVWLPFVLYVIVTLGIFLIPFLGALLIIAWTIFFGFIYISFVLPSVEAVEEPVIQTTAKIANAAEGNLSPASNA